MTTNPASCNTLSDAHRRLRCLIEGESHTFPVTISGSERITDLKERIHEKGINSNFCDILAKDLVLLKASYVLKSSINITAHFSTFCQVDVDLESHRGTFHEFAFKKDDEGVELLKEWNTVSSFWPDQSANRQPRLQIFVKLPSYSE